MAVESVTLFEKHFLCIGFPAIYNRTQLYRTFKANRDWFDIAPVRYNRTFLEANQINWKSKTVRYSGDLLYPMFDIAEFDYIIYRSVTSEVDTVW